MADIVLIFTPVTESILNRLYSFGWVYLDGTPTNSVKFGVSATQHNTALESKSPRVKRFLDAARAKKRAYNFPAIYQHDEDIVNFAAIRNDKYMPDIPADKPLTCVDSARVFEKYEENSTVISRLVAVFLDMQNTSNVVIHEFLDVVAPTVAITRVYSSYSYLRAMEQLMLSKLHLHDSIVDGALHSTHSLPKLCRPNATPI